jgi:hypothetical protein
MATIIAVNTTASPLAINTLSAPDRVIPATGQVDLTLYNTVTQIQQNAELYNYILNNQVVLNDGTKNLTKEQSLNLSSIFVSTAGSNSADTNEPNGFVTASDATMSLVGRVFTIQPAVTRYVVYSGGNRFVKEAAMTTTIAASEGLHYIYFDTDGTLKSTQTFSTDLITKYAIVTIIYWDNSNNVALWRAEERHGMVMDGSTHLTLHNALGSVWGNGLALNNLLVDGNGSLNTHAQIGVDNGSIYDEDVQFTITDGSPQDISPIGQIPVYYRTGASPGVWRKKTATNYPVIHSGSVGGYGGTRLAWNQLNAGTWQLTEATDTNYVLAHIFATTNITEPIVSICGQGVYNSAVSARSNAATEINNLVLSGLPGSEFRPIATLIFQTATAYVNTPKARIVSYAVGVSYVDWRLVNYKPGGGVTPQVQPILNIELSATLNATTTSLTDAVIDSMSVTPGAGTYLVTFSTSWSNGTNNISNFVSIYANNLQLPHSERTMQGVASNIVYPIMTNGIVTVADNQIVEIRWRVGSASTLTARQRSMTLIRLS